MRQIIFAISLLVVFSSCQLVNPSRMLRTDTDYEYSEFPDSIKYEPYRIAPNDILYIRIFNLNGEMIFDPTTDNQNKFNISIQDPSFNYQVDYDSTIKLPSVRRIKVAGMTIRDAESTLEKLFAEYIQDPFVQIKITNNRVIIFPGGEGGNASILYLENTNTTLFEALAHAGGITHGKAHKIKLIRGNLKDPDVYLIDLSTIEGMKQADLVLQANDIIYVEPREGITRKVLSEITPYISMASTLIVIYSLFSK